MSVAGTIEKSFLSENFLLESDFARVLYHDYVKTLPLIDYHNHLLPADIATDRQFENLTQAWLEGDHYKWRAMRALGISENFITGKASDREKFTKWAYTVPYTVRNPLFHWSHLELWRYFQIESLLSPDTEDKIYTSCSEMLSTKAFSIRNLLMRMNVETVCTTDDPVDTLEHHSKITAEGKLSVTVLPTFRPDKAYDIENSKTYSQYLETLSARTNIEIKSYEDLILALKKRIDAFHAVGCRLSDHGLEQLCSPTPEARELNVESVFQKVRNHIDPSPKEVQFFKSSLLLELCRMYHGKGWTQQFHLGALRNTNTRRLRDLGPDTGFDSIGDFSQGSALAKFLDALDNTDQLAKTILYNLNPSDNEVMASMIGNFNDGSVKGKIQFGTAWWFLDQKDGIEKQLNALSNLGLLSCFIGMVTDSRSFLSFPRHEYFRRILCNLIGEDVNRGELPADEKWLGKIVSDVCYSNAKAYFKFPGGN